MQRVIGGDIIPLAGVVDRLDARFALGLRADEKAELLAYIEARDAHFRLAVDAIASALVTRCRQEDLRRALLLLETIACDLDTPDVRWMRDLDPRDEACWLADALAEVGQKAGRGAWDEAQALWERFRGRRPS
jgi:hypothetical protein